MAAKALKKIILQGSPYERGIQHGEQLKNEIRDFLNDNFARINLIRQTPLSSGQISSIVSHHQKIINEDVPGIAEEIKGLAKGAGISYQQAVLLQIRRELINYPGTADQGDCTAAAFLDPELGAVTAQTIDLNSNMSDLGCVLHSIPDNPEHPEMLMYSFAGLLGYLGINSAGISVGINMLLSDGWKPGVSPYLLVRQVLGQSSLEDCIKEITRVRRSSSRNFLITSGQKLVNIELTADDIDIIENSTITHTNHYLHEKFLKHDRINILSKNSSIRRLDILNKRIIENNKTPDVSQLFEIFSDHSLYPVGICAHSQGNIRLAESVGAVVLYPQAGIMYARKGNPCKGKTEVFSLGRHKKKQTAAPV